MRHCRFVALFILLMAAKASGAQILKGADDWYVDSGTVISQTNAVEYKICNSEYDVLVKGVYSTSGITATSKMRKAGWPVPADSIFNPQNIVSSGIVYVKSDSVNGRIRKNDPITSGLDGRAIKATKTGVILGIALEDAIAEIRFGYVRARIIIQYLKL